MWSSNDSLPPYFIYYIFIIYLNLALTSCRASLISFCGDEEQKEIKKTVCLTRMRACTYFKWVIWILNQSSYVFCKNIYIFPSSCLTPDLAVYFCKLSDCLTLWLSLLSSQIRHQSGRCAVSGVFRNTQSGDTICTTLCFTVFLYYSEVRGVQGVFTKSYITKIGCLQLPTSMASDELFTML